MTAWGSHGLRAAALVAALCAAGCPGAALNDTTLKPADAGRLIGGTTYQYDHFRVTLPPNWVQQTSTEISGGTAYVSDLMELVVVPHQWRADQLFSFWIGDYEERIRRDPEWHVQKEWKIDLGGHEGRLYDINFRGLGAQIAMVAAGPGQAVELRYTAQRALLDENAIILFHTILQHIEFEALPPSGQ